MTTKQPPQHNTQVQIEYLAENQRPKNYYYYYHCDRIELIRTRNKLWIRRTHTLIKLLSGIFSECRHTLITRKEKQIA